ncbi:hypothetical protein FNV43_RR04211 [Rhamnella rubrinervis]|uniref:Uncharacterized protein n=1 Tax=Rhamnella rubrinervis TaxID=2594499 RepID=A0A8K0MQD6_9ROSA|nr:hypothetical protein FNV43_RR04211 [Rhamnella rubrinervis]
MLAPRMLPAPQKHRAGREDIRVRRVNCLTCRCPGGRRKLPGGRRTLSEVEKMQRSHRKMPRPQVCLVVVRKSEVRRELSFGRRKLWKLSNGRRKSARLGCGCQPEYGHVSPSEAARVGWRP